MTVHRRFQGKPVFDFCLVFNGNDSLCYQLTPRYIFVVIVCICLLCETLFAQALYRVEAIDRISLDFIEMLLEQAGHIS
jgi:hypothetical protein